VLVECNDCQSIQILSTNVAIPDECAECSSPAVTPFPYLHPPGFTVDASLPNFGREKYKGDGRERSGYVAPARLLVGQNSLNNGKQQINISPALYTQVRVGDLFVSNKGPDPQFPGFVICPKCGRSLDPDDLGTHKYPANIPPHYGPKKGPRAGDTCPNKTNFSE